jgi:hypothetical protein
MTIGSNSLHESNLGSIHTINATILGSGWLINPTDSLANAEPTITIYKMLGCATIL